MNKYTKFIIFNLILALLSGCKKDEPNVNYGSITDIDGNSYKTISIGTQTWMADNLTVLHYQNGDTVKNVTDDSQWSVQTNGAFCWYDNNESQYRDSYGALYNNYAVTDSRNICPTGWRIPTQTDWETLGSFLGGKNIAGGKLKETGTTLWYYPNTSASDESKFSSVPGGDRHYGGQFEYIRQMANYWASSAASTTSAYFYFISFEGAILGTGQINKKSGFSVRCIKVGDDI